LTVDVTYSVREQQEVGYGPVTGSYVAAGGAPPDDGTLIKIKGRLMRVVAVRSQKFDRDAQGDREWAV
jgi:hypothetical protein